MKQLIQQIEQWAEERNLIKGSTPEKQILKLMEEFGELCGGIAKNKTEVIKDSIGDCFVVLTILNAQYRIKSIGRKSNFHQNMVEPRGFYVHKDLDTAMLTALKNFSACYDYGYIPTEWSIHDSVNILSNIADLNNLKIKDCVQHAYDQIKDRKGKMIDGVFVKEEDLCD